MLTAEDHGESDACHADEGRKLGGEVGLCHVADDVVTALRWQCRIFL